MSPEGQTNQSFREEKLSNLLFGVFTANAAVVFILRDSEGGSFISSFTATRSFVPYRLASGIRKPTPSTDL